MTDIKDRFAGMLAEEPPERGDIDRVIATGRRRRRRRTTLVSVAGTAGTAAVTAAIVVPLAVYSGAGSTPGQVVAVRASTQPTKPPCKDYYAHPTNHRALKRDLQQLVKQWRAQGRHVASIDGSKLKGVRAISVCSVSPDGIVKLPPSAAPTSTDPATPKYQYTVDPQTIAAGFDKHLADVVDNDGLPIVFTRPFAQETSQLEAGHPSYYDGNVDVTTGTGNQGDIGVQVTHAVTEQVRFDGPCNGHCVQTTLADGSVLQTDQVRAGKGTILTAEVHHPNGLVVKAQESDYGFGPNAPVRTYGAQPLTLDELTAMAEDPAFSF